MQGRNTLGYLRTRTFYTPERKYAYIFTCLCPMFDRCILGYIYLLGLALLLVSVLFDHCIPGYIDLLGLALLPVSVQCLIILYLAIFTCLCPMFDHCIPVYIYLLGLALFPDSVPCLIIVYLAIFTC